jgi:secreted PhoX family phosphatase
VNDEMLRKLDQRLNRRSFLKGSGLAAAALLGAVAFPLAASAQDQQKQDEKAEARQDDKAEDKTSGDKDSEKKDPNAPTEDEFTVTRKDENGRDFRVCPQCGYNMYRQDRTWTCENCGFSYTD